MTYCYDVHERSTMSWIENMDVLLWQRKWFITSISPPVPSTLTAGYASAVPLLHTPLQLFGWGGQQHIRPSLPILQYHQRLSTHSHGHNLPTEASMATVDPVKCTSFRNIFRTAADDTSEGLYTSTYVDTNGHWENWPHSAGTCPLIPYLSRTGTCTPSSTPS